MPEREFTADARTKFSSRSRPSVVTISSFARSIGMLIGPRRLLLPDNSNNYSALKRFNRYIGSVWDWISWERFRSLLTPIYRLYEHDLDRQVRAFPVPRHIGLILDGNRRYGRKANLVDPREVYMAGANKLDELLEWCITLQIPAITLWVLSTENLKRPREEVTGILGALEEKLKLLANDHQIHNGRIRVRAVGRLELLPQSTLMAIRAAEEGTRDYNGMQLTIAAAYGGREEIIDAMQSLLREQLAQNRSLKDVVEMITPEAVARSLYAPDLPDPDLIIRTSGEIRLSGFLLWQSVFSEFYFTDVFWPSFRRIDFLRAVRAFQQRQRRFGK
jgi:short-chain Z-isoprenyl diphosphate synthase